MKYLICENRYPSIFSRVQAHSGSNSTRLRNRKNMIAHDVLHP